MNIFFFKLNQIQSFFHQHENENILHQRHFSKHGFWQIFEKKNFAELLPFLYFSLRFLCKLEIPKEVGVFLFAHKLIGQRQKFT